MSVKRIHLVMALLLSYCTGFSQLPTKTTRPAQKSDTLIIQPKPILAPVKILAPEKKEEEEKPLASPVKEFAKPPNEFIIDFEAMDRPLLVSKVYQQILRDNSIYIDHGGEYDIIRKKNGDYLLAYGASSENKAIRLKGLLFNLGPQFNQIESPRIFTQFNEDLLSVKLDESSLAYFCKDALTIDQTGYNVLKHDLVLKYADFLPDGRFAQCKVDVAQNPNTDKFDLKGINNNHLIYNFNNKARIGMVLNSNNCNYTIKCNLKPLPKQESFSSGSLVQPGIQDAWFINNYDYLIHTNTKYTTPVWNLTDKGITSGRKPKEVWPLLVVNYFSFSGAFGQEHCEIDNDPYTPIEDPLLKLEHISKIVPLSDGKLCIIQSNDGINEFHVFDGQLNRLHPPRGLAPVPNFLNSRIHIEPSSISAIEVGTNWILLLFMTRSGDFSEFRAVLYDWIKDEIRWSGTEVLWQEKYDWENRNKYRLLPYDDHRLVIFNMASNTQHFINQQNLEIRFLTVKPD